MGVNLQNLGKSGEDGERRRPYNEQDAAQEKLDEEFDY